MLQESIEKYPVDRQVRELDEKMAAPERAATTFFHVIGKGFLRF
jgi:hypothetical protein